MKNIEIKTIISEYDSYHELEDVYINLIEAARSITKSSYAPYSNFNVGAAVLLENGEVICGTNQENAAYPSGLCAERVALFYANTKYPDIPVTAIAITSSMRSKFLKEAVAPCGACRQVMLETETRYNSTIKVILGGDKKVNIIKDARQLLPLSFDGEFLK